MPCDRLSVPQNLRRYKFGIANKCSQNWKTTQVMNDHMKYLLHILCVKSQESVNEVENEKKACETKACKNLVRNFTFNQLEVNIDLVNPMLSV